MTNRNKTDTLRKSLFTQSIVRENGLDRGGFEGWAFCEGMLFNAPHKWWGDRGKRDKPHEGLDLLLYADRTDRIGRLEPETRIPVMYDGVVTAIIEDFLGKSIIVAHRLPGCDGRLLLSIYGHTVPIGAIRPGKIVKEGHIIATLAGSGKSKTNVSPHLHVSLGWLSKTDLYDKLDWKTLNDPNIIAMTDPLEVLDGHYRVLFPEEENSTQCDNS